MDLLLTGVTTVAEGDFNPRDVASMGVDPRIQALRIKIQLQGVDEAQAAMLTEQFQSRCPIYTTLNRAAPIEITTETM